MAFWFLVSLLAVLFVFLCFGLGVRSKLYWIRWPLGDARFERLYRDYEHMAEVLLPGNHNGSGICDGLAFWWQLDVRVPGMVPLCVEWDTDGINASGQQSDFWGVRGFPANYVLLPTPGERL
jgi:hypothetical protein